MSTPIQDLSKGQGHSQIPSTNVQPPQDPEILNVLNEFEEEVAAASRTQQPAPMIHRPAVSHQIPSVPFPMQQHHQPINNLLKVKPLIQQDLLYKVAIIAGIALIVFYPGVLGIVYSKLPQYEQLLLSNDVLIRAVLFAIVLYMIMWKFNI